MEHPPLRNAVKEREQMDVNAFLRGGTKNLQTCMYEGRNGNDVQMCSKEQVDKKIMQGRWSKRNEKRRRRKHSGMTVTDESRS